MEFMNSPFISVGPVFPLEARPGAADVRAFDGVSPAFVNFRSSGLTGPGSTRDDMVNQPA